MTNFPVKFPHVSPEVKLKYAEFTIFSEKRILLTKQKKKTFLEPQISSNILKVS